MEVVYIKSSRADGDEALVPPLVALLERSRQTVSPELRVLAHKVESDAAKAAARAASGAGPARADDSDEDEQRQMQIANRNKQLARHEAKKNQGRGGRR